MDIPEHYSHLTKSIQYWEGVWEVEDKVLDVKLR